MKFSEISNNLRVNDFDFDPVNGLWINYSLNGIDMDLIQTEPEGIAEVLKIAGYIECYSTRDGLMVAVERNIRRDGIEMDVPVNIQWEDFILDFSIDQKDAINIAVCYEQDKLAKGHFKHFLSIPEIISAV